MVSGVVHGRAARATAFRMHRMANVASADILVRRIDPGDRFGWLELWAAYCAFYETVVPERVTEHTWQRIVSGDSTIGALVALHPADTILGFAHYVVHPYTWGEQPCCYLEDLFVRPAARGKGVGAALIEWLLALCGQQGWSRLYWMTREGNVVARRLYDRFAVRDDFVRYTVAVRERAERAAPGDV
jgi:GNAT superfamily N-acetyltransferase